MHRLSFSSVCSGRDLLSAFFNTLIAEGFSETGPFISPSNTSFRVNNFKAMMLIYDMTLNAFTFLGKRPTINDVPN